MEEVFLAIAKSCVGKFVIPCAEQSDPGAQAPTWEILQNVSVNKMILKPIKIMAPHL